jgi:hypothetical protein
MKINEVEARYDANYGYVLLKHGKESFCPYQQPLPTQGIGGMGLMRFPCSTLCPQAKIKTNSEFVDGIITEQTYYEVGCSKTEYKINAVNKTNIDEK